MAKEHRFTDYNVDIERLARRIESYLLENHFEVAFSKDKTIQKYFIQARKLGLLRTTSGTRRSTDITINGVPDDFEITIRTGEWGNNLIVSAPLFVIPIIGIVATLARLYTAKKFEKNLWRYIKEQSAFLRSSTDSKRLDAKPVDERVFDCDYVEGYSGWEKQILGGKLILERQKSGIDRVIFEAPDGEQITIPAAKIEQVSMITGRNGIRENDLLLEITCHDQNGVVIKPILNLAANTITGVLAGINELVIEDKYFRNVDAQS